MVEALGEQIADGAAELLVGERIGAVGFRDVPGEVDLRSRHPGGPAQPEPRLLDPLAEPGERRHPLAHLIAKPLHGEARGHPSPAR